MRLVLVLAAILFTTPVYSQAVWGGRSYSHRVCSNPGCRMCASIQRQLTRSYATPSYSPPRISIVRQVPTVPSVRAVPAPVPIPQPLPQPAIGATAPTPEKAINAILDVLDIRPGDVVCDLGCGDGRWLVAALDRGAEAWGIERSKTQIKLAKDRLQQAGHTATIIEADLTEDFPVPPATVFTMYLYQDVMSQVIPRLPSGARGVSYLHKPAGTKGRKYTFPESGAVFWVWRQP